MTMGEMIKQLRKEYGYTQTELGKQFDPPVNKAAVNKWESGLVSNLKRSQIEKMASLFHISPSKLMCLNEPNEPPCKKEQTKMIKIPESEDSEAIDTMIYIFTGLNEEGQEEVLNHLNYIASQEKYLKRKKEYKNA